MFKSLVDKLAVIGQYMRLMSSLTDSGELLCRHGLIKLPQQARSSLRKSWYGKVILPKHRFYIMQNTIKSKNPQNFKHFLCFLGYHGMQGMHRTTFLCHSQAS